MPRIQAGETLMSRGFKRDISATREAYASGRLIDSKRRSFISQPKIIPGECETPQPHLILWGADKTAARMALFIRENSRCQKCGCVVEWGGEEQESWNPLVGQWMHPRDKAGQKCDCEANRLLACNNCHQGPGSAHHKARTPRWGPQKILV